MEPDKPADTALPLEVPEEGTFETYANVVDADWSLTDVTLRFLQIGFGLKQDGPMSNKRELVYLEKANITIPWWQAKVAADLLTRLVKLYESTNGELQKPVLPTPHATPESE